MLKLSILSILVFAIFLQTPDCEAARKAKQPQQTSNVEEATYPPLETMAAAMLMVGFRGQTIADNDKFAAALQSGKVANVILFDKDLSTGGARNINSPEQLRKLCARLRELGALFIAVDQEGGQARRLRPQKGFQDLPSAQAMGQGSPHETLQKAESAGKELKELGINVDFAPVVDVDSNPFNPLIGRLGRAFSSDAKLVAAHALAFGRGLAKSGVIPVLKHFPGQGCAEKDTHQEATDVTMCWNAQIDLVPYADIFQSGWPGMVMTGHILVKSLDSANPATLSPKIINGLLRNGLGWQGVVVSDDLQMKAASDGRDLKEIILAALNAGVDILLFGNNIEWDENLPEKAAQTLLELVAEKSVSEERIKESWRRISSLAGVYGLMDNIVPASENDSKAEQQPASDGNVEELLKHVGS